MAKAIQVAVMLMVSSLNGSIINLSRSFSLISYWKVGSQFQIKEGSGNLWQSILNDVAARDDIRESHVLVLGDRGAGKRSLIQSINKHCVRATNKFIEVDKMGS